MNKEGLKDKYRDQTAWIIGTGPSIQFLSTANIGEGPVIALNQAITIVENIGAPNDIYSSQKDGGARRNGRKAQPGSDVWFTPDCDYSGIECSNCIGAHPLKPTTTLILHDLESKYCFPDHEKRFVFSFTELGLLKNEFSQIFTLKLAQYMGCDKFVFVSFDSQTVSDFRNHFNGVQVPAYAQQTRRIWEYLRPLDCYWITPKDKQ